MFKIKNLKNFSASFKWVILSNKNMLYHKIKYIFIFKFLFFLNIIIYSQTIITGIVKDSTNNNTISNLNVYITPLNSPAVLAYNFTNQQGKYTIKFQKKGTFLLHFNSLSYRKKSILITCLDSSVQQEIHVFLTPEIKILNEVFVQNNAGISIKKDTILIDVKQFTKGNEKNVEEVLKKLPGINVDKDGTIKIKDKEVEKVMVEGDDFLDKGYKLLTKNMQGNAIDKVEVLQKYSNNKLLKGVEYSEKVALNLILKDKYKLQWFGNANIDYDPIKLDRYDVGFTLQSYSKKTKYFFIGNANSIGDDPTGNVYNIIHPFSFDDNANIGEDVESISLLKLQPNSVNIGKSRSIFNNDELLSFNFIFNPTPKLKIKPIIFTNWTENYFYRNSIQNYNFNNTQFTNTENYDFKKNFITYFGKLDISYDLAKNMSLQYIGRYSNRNENNNSNLIFNNLYSNEKLNEDNILQAHKFIYTHRLKEKKALIITSNFIDDKRPQTYKNNQFNFAEYLVFPTFLPIVFPNNTIQFAKNNVLYWGTDAHYFYRKDDDNLIELKFGFEYRKDNFYNQVNFYKDENIIFSPTDFNNDFIISTSKIFTSAQWRKAVSKKYILFGKLNLNQFFNHFSDNNELEIQNNNSIIQDNNPILLTAQFGSQYVFNKTTKSFIYYQYSNQNIAGLEIMPNYYLTDFRTLNKGLGNFTQLAQNMIFLNFQKGNWGSTFFKIDLFLLQSPEYITSNATYTQVNNRIQKIIQKDKLLYSTNIEFNHFLNALKSNLKFKINYNQSTYQDITNTLLRKIKTNNISFGTEIRSGFTGFFNFHIGGSINKNQFTILQTTDNEIKNYFLDLYFDINTNLNASIKNEFYDYSYNDKKYLFTDAEIRYVIKKDKVDIGVQIRNVFDIINFTNYAISETGNSTVNYTLQPRIVLFHVGFKL